MNEKLYNIESSIVKVTNCSQIEHDKTCMSTNFGYQMEVLVDERSLRRPELERLNYLMIVQVNMIKHV